MLRCASPFVIAAYVSVRLIPQGSRALPAAFLRSRPTLLFYLLVRQVAGGVGRPDVSRHRLRPGAEIAAADVEPAAGRTAPLHVGLLVLALRQQGIGHVGPDFTERALPDVPERDSPPELVGVDLAVPAYAADPVAGAVPLVHHEEFQHLGRPLWVFPQAAEIDVGAVGVVIHREDLLRDPPSEEVLGPVHDQIEERPRLFMREVLLDQFRAAARVDEGVEAAAGDVFGFEQLEDRRDIGDVVAVDREADADLNPPSPPGPAPFPPP